MCFCSFHIFQHVSFQFSDDEGDDKRVVRSAKEKRFEALYSIIKTIRNSMKIKDFNKMLSSYEELLKAFDKAKPVIVKEREKDKAEGKSTSWLVGDSPKFYVRILVEMEKLINETWEDTAGRKAMSKVNGKSLGSLRQKLRKYMRENVADDVAKFDPEEEDESGEEGEEKDDDDDSDDDRPRGKSEEKEKVKKPRASMDDGSDSDSDDWGDSDSDSDSDEEHEQWVEKTAGM